MKIDKKHFPPISLLEVNKSNNLVIPTPLQPFLKTNKKLEVGIKALVLEGRENIITSTKEAEKLMIKHKRKCFNDYLRDPNKKAFGGAYIDMEMPVPSMDFFKIIPSKYKNEETGIEEDEIKCLCFSVQGNNNTVISYGMVTFKDFKEDSILVQTALACINDEERTNTINYMKFLLELNCFMEYGKESDKNIQKIYGNQRKCLPDGYVIDNRSGHIIRCLCTPKKCSCF